jgi:adenylyltransferase/sulfurtransferase
MKEITVQELKQWREMKVDFQLIDVREEHEYEMGNIGGELIPMGQLLEKVDIISKEKPVVVHCRSGVRSATVINQLEKKYGFTNLANLKGGILAYAKEIDNTLSIS